MSLYPCLQDGRFLVEFYICHPSDSWCNAINQCANFSHHSPQWKLISSIHLILWLTKPIAINFQHSKKWVNLTHRDTFIQGPFDFSSINGRKTQDRVSQPDWDVLKSHCHMFHNPLPWFDVLSYSIHVDRGAHVLFSRCCHYSSTNLNGIPHF